LLDLGISNAMQMSLAWPACALAAVGKGNREIAHALFVSVKTVETHLAAAYRKLGIRAREDIAPALAA
jgi:DNA-binding CsgD family transcriptional regulator